MEASVAQSSQCSASGSVDTEKTSLNSYCCTNNINTPYQSFLIINTREYHEVVSKLRAFSFQKIFLKYLHKTV